MKSIDMVIDGKTFTVNELSLKDMLPFIKDSESNPLKPLDLVQFCVTVDGQPFDPDIHEISFSTFNTLSDEVSKINGMVETEKKD